MKYYQLLLLIALFCSNVANSQAQYKLKTRICLGGTANESTTIGSYLYTIQNKAKQKLLIFFMEEGNKSLPRIQLLRRKLLRRYGDFSLSFIEWEADMEIEKSYIVSPELFVKVLEPKGIFNIVIPFTSHEEKRIASQVAQHLLLCPEDMLSSDLIPMPHFIENLQRYDFIYPSAQVAIPAHAMTSFVQQSDNRTHTHE